MHFGGARKHLPDGMRLRGDINILMLGDPSVGKSQFLKYAMQVAPIGVYTSGKGSSAAGLTASVIKDGATGEFHLEGGALVLADGGMVCIDEFDKMRDQDRVAIHEAMEQQTISIAKAGITTILNSRCSILAAANPVFSRYDDSKTATENIEFQTTILSRFDLIFIMRDIVNTKRDEMMATHIVNVHKGGHASVHGLGKGSSAVDDPNLIPMDKLKRYIAYSRHHVSPRLSASAAELLKNRYVTFRSDMREFAKGGTVGTAIPITVRQLEAIVRISESLAKMELKSHVNENHVNEALRLFKVSTMQAATSEASNRHAVGGAGFDAALKRAESVLEQRLPIGSSASVRKLLTDMLHHNIEELAARRALDIGVSRGRYRWKMSRKMVERIN
jgi:DNA replication licensing factor MCM5